MGLSLFSGTSWVLQASQCHLCLLVMMKGMLQEPSHSPLIFILHQYLVIGRWWILTSVIQRHKNLMYVICKSALNYSRGKSGHVSCWAHTQGFASTATHKWSFKGFGNILTNGPEKSHPNLYPWPALVWLLTFLNPGQHKVLLYLKIFANLLSRQKKHLLVLFIYISLTTCEIEKCHMFIDHS